METTPTAIQFDDEHWPTNFVTITCSMIDGILLIITIIIYTSLCIKTCKHLTIEDEIVHPNSAKNQRKRESGNSISSPKDAHNHQPIHRFILYGTLISCTFILSSNILTFLYTINSQNYICCARLMTFIQIITIGIAKIFHHLVFVRRLYITFQGSEGLKYKNWVFYLIYMLFFIGLCGIISLLIFIVFSENNQFLYVAAVAFAMDFVGSVLILMLFIKKLHKVFIQRKTYSVRDVHKPIKLDPPDKQLINTMTKLTLLSSLSALGSLFLFVLFTIRAIQESGRESEGYKVWEIVYTANIFFMLSAMINCMALYLILSFASDHYDNFCKHLHGVIERCCDVGYNGTLHRKRRKWIETSVEIENTSQTFKQNIDNNTPNIPKNSPDSDNTIKFRE